MEKVLLGYALDSLKAFGKPVGIVFHNALHPNVNGKRTVKLKAEKQSARSAQPANRVTLSAPAKPNGK